MTQQASTSSWPMCWTDPGIVKPIQKPCSRMNGRKKCLRARGELQGFLVDLCINPEVTFDAPGHTDPPSAEHRARRRWFKDIIGALYEYQRRHAEKVRSDLVMTEIGRMVFDTLDVCLARNLSDKRIVICEGDSGVGKTTATEAWCQAHFGEARFVSLSGVSNKTAVFRAIAKALGLASSYSRTATEMQSRVEDVLEKSQLVLVLDEAHYLLSGAERIYAVPELVNWINTACFNRRVIVALICTPQFIIRANRAEQQTSWNSDQLRRRVKRFIRLPAKPTSADLEAVARKLCPMPRNG